MIIIDDNALDLDLWNLIIKKAILEILGEHQGTAIIGLDSNTALSIPFIHNSLDKMMGYQPASGVEYRIGQAVFRNLLTLMGDKLGFFRRSYKFSNLRNKTVAGFSGLMELYCKLTGEKASFFETEVAFRLSIWSDREVKINDNGCQFLKGFIIEFMSWVSCGKVYDVRHEHCRSSGHEKCIYNINKVPLE